MKKIIVFTLIVLFGAVGLDAKPTILVTSDKNVYCHASEMKKSLEYSNRNYKGIIALKVFCQNGFVKYITIDKRAGAGEARFVPRDHLVYKICGNPCK